MMRWHKKLWTLLFLVIAVVAIILLSASLSELELLPGKPFPFGWKLQGWRGSWAIGRGDIIVTLFRALLVLFVLLIPLAVVYLIISPEARKRVFTQLAYLLMFFAIFYLLMRARLDLRMEEMRLPELSPSSMPEWLSGESTLEFIPDPPQWLTLAMSLGLAVLVAAALVSLVWFVWRCKRPTANPMQQLAQEARDALEALQAGADLRDIVVSCYFKMTHVVNEQRGIKRRRDGTPREFEHRLEEAGLPGEPVRRLTRLFEEVRYGTKITGEDEERQAIKCLTAIVEACRSSS